MVQIYTNKVQIQYKYDTNIYKYGINMVQIWYKYIQIWYKYGTNMVQYIQINTIK